MFVLILKGTSEDGSVEVGLDEFAQIEGKKEDSDFIIKNSGPGKMFPGGPQCTYRGKHIPCLVRWSEKGSMTPSILRDVLSELDRNNLFPLSDNPYIRLFTLFYGHGSRIERDFLTYINSNPHLWVVCISVPYGTSIWQVGDSKEQNGSFNIVLGVVKSELVKKRQSTAYLLS